MKIIPQNVLILTGFIAITIVIVAVFFVSASPQNKSLQKERIFVNTAIRPTDPVRLEPIKISDTKPNTAYYFTYPQSGDKADAYQKFILVRLPEEFGGDKDDISAFRAYSALGLSSHCLMKYWPQEERKRIEEPCYGDIVRIQDGLIVTIVNPVKSGVFSAVPYLELSADSIGYLYVEPPVWEMDKNGVVGIGRSVSSDDFKNAAQKELENYITAIGVELEIPSVLSDGTIITPYAENGKFLYRHPQDARIIHGFEISYCNCTHREPFSWHGGFTKQTWVFGVERFHTDQWTKEKSGFDFAMVTFYRNGYELSLSGPTLEKTLDLVFDNFYPGKNRSILQKIDNAR